MKKRNPPKGRTKSKYDTVSNLPAVIPPPDSSDWVLLSEKQIADMTDERRLELLNDVTRRMSSETNAYRKRNAEYACTLGRILIVQKGKLKHGEWIPWVTKHTQFSLRQIERWIHSAETWNTRKSTNKLNDAVALEMSQRAFTLMNKPVRQLKDEETKRPRERKRKEREESYDPHDLAAFIAEFSSGLSFLRQLIQNPVTEKQVDKLFLPFEEVYQEWDSLRANRAKAAELPAPEPTAKKRRKGKA